MQYLVTPEKGLCTMTFILGTELCLSSFQPKSRLGNKQRPNSFCLGSTPNLLPLNHNRTRQPAFRFFGSGRILFNHNSSESEVMTNVPILQTRKLKHRIGMSNVTEDRTCLQRYITREPHVLH